MFCLLICQQVNYSTCNEIIIELIIVTITFVLLCHFFLSYVINYSSFLIIPISASLTYLEVKSHCFFENLSTLNLTTCKGVDIRVKWGENFDCTLRNLVLPSNTQDCCNTGSIGVTIWISSFYGINRVLIIMIFKFPFYLEYLFS